MELIFSLLLILLVFDIAALNWGVDSTDPINSPEWEKRARRGRSF